MSGRESVEAGRTWEYLEFVQETVDGAWTRVMWSRRQEDTCLEGRVLEAISFKIMIALIMFAEQASVDLA